MARLKDKLFEKIEQQRPRVSKLMKEYGDVIIDEVTVEQVIGGMRGIKSLLTDISYLDPMEGIRYRGFTLAEIFEKLPKPKNKEMPYVEGLVYLLLTGEIPGDKEVDEVLDEFQKRRILPRYVYEVIDSMPCCSHPMTIFSSAVMAMQRESFFAKKYRSGLNKMEYWDSTYEDAMNLIAKLPEVGSYIYTKLYRDGKRIQQNPNLDFGGNFAHMMGIPVPFDEVARLYFIIHADHEAGNVSAHTGHLVASSLADVYLSIASMINGLAGPLHGLANQEVLRWLLEFYDKMEGKVPTEDEMKQFVWDTLNGGFVIPGYGHAVLRKTDPRYTIQREVALRHMSDDPLFQYVDMLYKVVPPILLEQGKAKNPWPNVDAMSGTILWHYGLREYDFFTVLFGIGRAIGICANIIWDRALAFPLERPKSITTDMLEKMAMDPKAKRSKKKGGGE